MAHSPKSSKIFPVWLGQWLSHLKVGQKIALGYGLVLGIAIIGSSAGFKIADRYKQQAYKLEEDAVEEIHFIHNLQTSFLATQLHQHELIEFVDNPEEWHQEYTHFQKYFGELNKAWSEFQQNDGNIVDDKHNKEKVEAINKVLDKKDELEKYLQDTKKSLQQFNSYNLQTPESRLALVKSLEDIQESSAFNADYFSDIVQVLLKITYQEYEEAQRDASDAEVLQVRIVATTLLLSILSGALLAFYTARAIARPLKAVTDVAQQVTQESNFDLQAPITTKDEVSVLANFFNQLIQQVKYLLKEQIEANEQLEARVEERTAQLFHKTSELEAILNAFPDLFFRLAIDSTVLDYKAGSQSSEFNTRRAEEFLGKRLVEILPAYVGKKLKRAIAQTLQSESLVSIEYSLALAGGEQYYEGRLLPFATEQVILIVRNVSDRKLAEEALRRSEAQLREQAQDLEQTLKQLQQTQSQLIQTEKMSSLGQLVAGVAHEINNPVNFIYGNLTHVHGYTHDLLRLLQLYQQHIPNPPLEVKKEIKAIDLNFISLDLPKVLNSMQVGSERIKEIVLCLRNFSRLDEAEFKQVDIHEGIDNTLMILQHRLKSSHNLLAIEVIKQYGNLPQVECYAGQLNQVFMNILSNAIDALEDIREKHQNPVPSIHICTEVVEDSTIAISITDNGPGIDSQVRSRLFDPFFTTKAVGKGTGLGLSISYQIVTEKHGGKLLCYSAPGQGAEFVIEIPIHQQVIAS